MIITCQVRYRIINSISMFSMCRTTLGTKITLFQPSPLQNLFLYVMSLPCPYLYVMPPSLVTVPQVERITLSI